jgi:hypothetical protein
MECFICRGISVNYLNGSVPEEFGNMTSLQKWLNLSFVRK